MKWKEENKEQFTLQLRRYRRKRKQTLIDGYGGKCQCCGETILEFLTIDHIKGGGVLHRKQFCNVGQMYSWIIKNNFPKEYRILCMNCNFAIRFGNICPHKAKQALEKAGA